MMWRRYELLGFLMLDAAPVALGFPTNLLRIIDEAIGIAAIHAIELVVPWQVRKFVAINLNVLTSLHIRKAVELKANTVINLHADV
jgi:hypothetical protein